jgi:hypothetical protein
MSALIWIIFLVFIIFGINNSKKKSKKNPQHSGTQQTARTKTYSKTQQSSNTETYSWTQTRQTETRQTAKTTTKSGQKMAKQTKKQSPKSEKRSKEEAYSTFEQQQFGDMIEPSRATSVEQASYESMYPDTDHLLDSVYDIMVKGPEDTLSFQRDFLAEGIDMLNSYNSSETNGL